MARTRFIDLPEAQEELYYAGLQSGDRFTFPRITRKSAFFGRKKVAGLTRRSYLPAISTIWKTFTATQKQDWKSIDPHPVKHGWRTFVADQAKRIKFGIPGEATPNVNHQDMVGAIDIEAPAEETKIVQYHPAQYYVWKKVAGKKSMYNPVSVTETVSLPLVISLKYKTNLVSTGGGSFAKFYATVRHYYQGQNLDTDLVIDIPLSSTWTSANQTLSTLLGEIVGYTLYIHLYKVTGTLWFDTPKAEHSGQNWVRDPYCKNISMSFTHAFYQVPKNWAVITLPTGASYNSKYPD